MPASRWLFAGLVAALGSCATTALADCADPFRDPSEVLDLHLRMQSADWAALRADLDSQGDLVEQCLAQYRWFAGDFRCGEEDWIRIGVRKKRGEQRDPVGWADFKPPLKLDFNREVSGQRWPDALGPLGLRRVTLNNGQPDGIEDFPADPGRVTEYPILTALLTEHYAWRLMHAEVPTASRVAYARLTVHLADQNPEPSQYTGLYVMIEDIDRTALEARYPIADGRLRKTTDPDCPLETTFDDVPGNPTSQAADAWLAESPTPDAGWTERTEAVLDLEELLRQEAIRDVLANGDDTVSGGGYNNFFEFDPESGVRHYLPWDLDDCFRTYPQNRPADDPLRGTCAAELRPPSVVGERTRCQPAIQTRTLEIACQLINGTLAPERLLAGLAELDAVARPRVEEEAPLWAQVGYGPLDASHEGTYAAQYQRYQTWIPQRIASVRAQIEAAGVLCPEGCADGESEACAVLGCPGQRRCAGGRWTTCEAGVDCPPPFEPPPIEPPPVTTPDGTAAPQDPRSLLVPGGGCSCRTGPRSPSRAWPWLVAVLAVLARRRHALGL